MHDVDITPYSGISGRILRGAVSGATFLSGICLGLILACGQYILVRFGYPGLAAIYGQCVIAIALARYAVNGLTGEYQGTVFSTAGGSWDRVLLVAARYGALCLLWIIPLAFLAMSPDEAKLAIFGLISGQGSAQLIGLIFLVIAGMGLTPPIFLIGAVAAERFTDILSVGHWRRLLGGRRTDLYAMYSIYTGALAMMTVIAIPIALMAFSRGLDIGMMVGALLLSFLGGLSVALLGRLCGFFAFGEGDDAPALSEEHVEPEGHAAPPGLTPVLQARAREVAAMAAAPAASLTNARPALMDAPARLEEIQRRFETDPAGAIGQLQDLRAAHAPHPHVLRALCLLLSRAKRHDEAIEAAKEALPFCFARGYVPFAAEMVRALWAHRERLELNREQLSAVAAALQKAADMPGAIRVWGALVSLDPKELRGVKALMQIAGEHLHGDADPRQAVSIYSFLLKHCADSPLAEHMREGLADAERRQTRTQALGQAGLERST